MKAGEVARYDLGCKVDRYVGDVENVAGDGTFTPDQREVVDLLVRCTARGFRRSETGRGGGAAAGERCRGRAPWNDAHTVSRTPRPCRIRIVSLLAVACRTDYAEPSACPAGGHGARLRHLVVEGQGFYMEDMILVTRTGYEILTKDSLDGGGGRARDAYAAACRYFRTTSSTKARPRQTRPPAPSRRRRRDEPHRQALDRLERARRLRSTRATSFDLLAV